MDTLRTTDAMSTPSHGREPLADRALGWLVRRAFGDAPLRFAIADGTVLNAPPVPAVATIVLENRWLLVRLCLDPEVTLGEAYAAGALEIQGDLVAALQAGYRAIERRRPKARWTGRHSLRASRANVHRHYDLGNDFYKLWLDERMVYTCAYFPTPGTSLDTAQVAKMDHVCRKVDLRAGERVVEAGCGWGALALHMARRYGVSVTAYNISHEQIAYARQQAESEGLAGRVTFVEDDYRAIEGRYDAFVSVGMLEHVGHENYPVLGRIIDRCLDPERGRGLLHFIGRDRPRPLSAWIRRRIFPGAYAPTLAEAVEGVLQAAGFSVLDVENLRLHYARTLWHWLARYERAGETVVARYGEAFARAWRLYLAGSMAAFNTGSLQLFQVQFARGGSNAVAWTRAGLYEAEPSPDGDL
jgi:cyclopropane-fatty-acyl-phospholipid synthase